MLSASKITSLSLSLGLMELLVTLKDGPPSFMREREILGSSGG